MSQPAGFGRSLGVTGAAWDGSGLPWVIFQPERCEGRQHLGPARLMWPEPRHLWACPPGSGTQRMLGDLPHLPRDPPPPAPRLSWQGGDPCWAGASCGAEACAGSRFQLGLWEGGLVDSSRYFLPGFRARPPHVSTSVLSAPFGIPPRFSLPGGSLTPCTGGSLNPLRTRHGVHGPLSPIMRGGPGTPGFPDTRAERL